MGVEIVAQDDEIEQINVSAVWLIPAVLIGFAAVYVLVMLGRLR
jgi:hypothetical protein